MTTSLAIVGAGSIGRLWAAYLTSEEHVDFVTTRPLSAPQTLTYSLKQAFSPHAPQSQHQITLQAIETLEQFPSHILLCTKSHSAANTALELYKHLPHRTPLFLFQNGLGSQHKILNALPETPLFAAVTTEGANFHPPSSTLNHAGKGTTMFGPLNSAAQHHKDAIKALLNTNLSAQLTNQIWPSLWHKLIINCAINPYTALADCKNGDAIKTPRFQQDWPNLRQELSSLSRLAEAPLSEQEVEAKVFAVATSTSENISSMLQDVRSAKPTEIDDINGFAFRYLAEHGKSYGVNKQLWEDVNALRH
jgi:2-dehydropantoate 2-reductase